MSKTINIALLGLGTVGQGIVNVLKENNHEISQKVGFPINIKTVLVRNIEKAKAFDDNLNLTTDFSDIINDAEINIVVEVMGGENPARQYMLQALQAKKHVITANKDVVALHGREMFEAATAHKVDFMFEASVGGGIPIIRPLKQCLTANKITEVMGIVNGTTNYMLTKMSNEGMDYTQVLKEAQEKGYAESDPTADIGGIQSTVWSAPDWYSRIVNAAWPIELEVAELSSTDKSFMTKLKGTAISRSELNALYCKHYNLANDSLKLHTQTTLVYSKSKRSIIFINLSDPFQKMTIIVR